MAADKEKVKIQKFLRLESMKKENCDILDRQALGTIQLTNSAAHCSNERNHDSNDELIARRQQQPLINRPANPATGVPVAGTLDQHPSRNDTWSARMREKYGLDTSEFTYNPNESQGYQQAASQPTKQRCRCSIM